MPVDSGFFRKLSDVSLVEIARDVLGVDVAAKLLGVSRGTLDVWRSRGKKSPLAVSTRRDIARALTERIGDPLYDELTIYLKDVAARLANVERELIRLQK